MKKYHKIQSVYKREPKGKRFLIEGDYSLPEFELLKDIPWVCTEKVDGMNIRVGWENDAILFGGRTENSQLPSQLVNRLERLFLSNHDLFTDMFGDAEVCLYGEGYGAKIQKGGGNYGDKQDFVLFDINIDGMWLKRESILDIASRLELKVVPVIFEGTLDEIVELVRNGVNSVWGDFTAEGVVAHPVVELLTRAGDRIITKIKHKDFSR